MGGAAVAAAAEALVFDAAVAAAAVEADGLATGVAVDLAAGAAAGAVAEAAAGAAGAAAHAQVQRMPAAMARQARHQARWIGKSRNVGIDVMKGGPDFGGSGRRATGAGIMPCNTIDCSGEMPMRP